MAAPLWAPASAQADRPSPSADSSLRAPDGTVLFAKNRPRTWRRAGPAHTLYLPARPSRGSARWRPGAIRRHPRNPRYQWDARWRGGTLRTCRRVACLANAREAGRAPGGTRRLLSKAGTPSRAARLRSTHSPTHMGSPSSGAARRRTLPADRHVVSDTPLLDRSWRRQLITAAASQRASRSSRIRAGAAPRRASRARCYTVHAAFSLGQRFLLIVMGRRTRSLSFATPALLRYGFAESHRSARRRAPTLRAPRAGHRIGRGRAAVAGRPSAQSQDYSPPAEAVGPVARPRASSSTRTGTLFDVHPFRGRRAVTAIRRHSRRLAPKTARVHFADRSLIGRLRDFWL